MIRKKDNEENIDKKRKITKIRPIRIFFILLLTLNNQPQMKKLKKMQEVDALIDELGLKRTEIITHWEKRGLLGDSNKPLSERVRQVIMDKLNFPAEAVTDNASLQYDLLADSLSLMELIVDLEKKFDIHISDEKVKELKTVGDVIQYISENIS